MFNSTGTKKSATLSLASLITALPFWLLFGFAYMLFSVAFCLIPMVVILDD